MSGDVAGAASRWRARTLLTPGGLFLAAVLILAVLPTTQAIRDPDFWWHLRAGQLILDHHALLGTDPFTYTATSHHWTMHEWLTEVLFAALYRAGGLALIVLVLSAVTWLGLFCIVQRARLARPHWLPLGLGLLFATIAGYPIWGPRAQMITFALSCLVLWLVDRHLRTGDRAVWALVPLFLVWSNLHSGFVIGAAFIALVLVAEVGGHLLGLTDVAAMPRVRTLALVLLACAAVIVINPNGPQIYLYPFETQGSAAQQALILEWHSPDFHDWAVRTFELMLLSLAVMVSVNRGVSPRSALLALATTALALQSVRHIALFVAAATPLWIEQADVTLRRLQGWRAARSGRRHAPLPPPPLFFRVGAALALGAIGLLALTRVATAAATREDSLVYARDFPVCAARWLAAAPAGLHIFNQYGEGGYLADRLSARGDRVFIFGDAALMGDDLLTTYGDVEAVRPDWERILLHAGTDVVVFDDGTPLVHVLQASARWREVYHDGKSRAFVPVASTLALPPAPSWATGSADTCAQLAHDQTAVAQTRT